MKAFIYARQSSGGDDESLSIDVQVASCRQYAEKQGINTVDVFCDYNTSGRCFPVGAENIAEKDVAFQKWFAEKSDTSKMYRSELGKLFSRLDEVEVIVVDDITRLYRPLAASFLESYIHQILILNRIKIHTVKGGIINTASFNDSLLLSIQNQVESQAILVRTEKAKASLRRMKNEGWTASGKGSMIGYRQIGKQKYEINQSEVPYITCLYDMIVKGNSNMVICSYINSNFHLPNRGYLTTSHVARIIRRPEYCGMSYNAAGELIESKCFGAIPIISKTTWYKAQEVLGSKKKPCRERTAIFTVTGLVKCGVCGKRLGTNGAKDLKYFTCFDTFDRSEHLRFRYIARNSCFCYHEMKDNCFGLSYISDNVYLYEITYPLIVKTIIDEFLFRNSQDETEIEIKTVQSELDKLQIHEKKLSTMLLNEVIDDEQFATMAAEYKQKRNDLKSKLSTLNKNLCLKNDDVNVEQMFKEFVTGETDDKMVKVYIHKVVKSITVYKDKIHITMKDGKAFDLPVINLTKSDVHGRCRKTFPCWEVIGNLYGESTIIYYTGQKDILYTSPGLKIISECSYEPETI